jgi:hypothetical protein
MALVLADRVLETSTSEGLGTFALAGAQTGYQTFSSGIGNGNTCYYTINGQTTEQWEVGIGTVGAGTLERTTLISSNTGSFINFVAGVKNVFVTQPASKSIYKDASGNAIPLGSASATQLDITAQGDLRLQDTTGGEYVAIQAPATLASSYTLTMPVDDGTAGQALITDGSGVLSWSTAASGDVYGPASATDNAVARFDGTTGKIIQNSAVTIADDGATVLAVNSASDGLRITQIGAGNALLVEDSANPDASPFVVTADGTVIRGYTSPVVTDNYVGTQGTPLIQTHANATTASGLASFVWESSAVSPAPSVILSRSRSATIGSFSSVASGDAIGAINFNGDDGTDFVVGASILASVDGTPGTNDMPGRLVFSTTADGASSPTERMRIDSTGAVGIGTTSLGASYGLRVSKTFAGDNGSNIFSSAIGTASTPIAVYSFRSTIATGANGGTPYTITSLYGYSAAQGTLNADSTVTNQYGFHATSSLTGATNNYGFYSAIASGTGRYNFYAAGTADNYFAGDMQLDKTVTAGGTTGAQTINKNAGTVNFAAAATSLVVTNSRVTTSSIIVCTVGTNDTTLKSVAAVAGAGSFTLHASAAATAETRVNFLIIN